MRKADDGRTQAIRRRLGLDDLLTQGLKPTEFERLPRSMPGMRNYLKLHQVKPDGSTLVIGKLQDGLYKKPKSKPRPYNA